MRQHRQGTGVSSTATAGDVKPDRLQEELAKAEGEDKPSLAIEPWGSPPFGVACAAVEGLWRTG